jgi:cell division protein FtsB
MENFSVNWRRVGLFIGLAFLVLVVFEFNARLQELNRLSGEAEIYRTQATQAVQTQLALEEQVAYATSDAAVEEYARNDNHMIQEGEIPVVPYGTGNNQSVPTPTPSPSPTPLPNWQVWWNLFFGK